MSIALGMGTLPVGTIHFAAAETDGRVALVALGFGNQWPALKKRLAVSYRGAGPFVDGDPLGMAVRLARYSDGDLRAFDDVPVAPRGTAFQERVWALLRRIPAGTTCSYLDIARALGSPTATRAVGAANGRNPIALVIPCHRVIRSDGALAGYAGRVENKQWLLAHELKSENRRPAKVVAQ